MDVHLTDVTNGKAAGLQFPVSTGSRETVRYTDVMSHLRRLQVARTPFSGPAALPQGEEPQTYKPKSALPTTNPSASHNTSSVRS
jgi:hypothetical protein